MTWSASGAVRIASSRDSDTGMCPTTCTCSKSLCSPSVVCRYARESVSAKWRFFPCTHINSTSYFCSHISSCRHFDALANASLRMHSKCLWSETTFTFWPYICMVEFLQTPHYRQHFLFNLGVSCFGVC